MRAGERQRRRFSEVLAQGIADPRLYGLMSLRADFFGELQKDAPLYKAHRLISVPPLGEAELLAVVTQPAKLLSVRFETDHLAADITRRAAEDSAKDAGALPLLSYLLDDMWRQHGGARRRHASPAGAIDRPWPACWSIAPTGSFPPIPVPRTALRRIFTLKLATVREDGEPTRRRAWRRSFPTRSGGWSASLPTIRTACSSPRRPKAATPSGGGARGDLPALGQVGRVDRRRARVPRLAQRARSRASRLAGSAGSFETRRAAHGLCACPGAKLARQALRGPSGSRTAVHRAEPQGRSAAEQARAGACPGLLFAVIAVGVRRVS